MIEVVIGDREWARALPDHEALVIAAAEATLNALPDAVDVSEVVVLLTDDRTVWDLNIRFRGKNSPTNVLSFPSAGTAAEYLGDIALAYGVCASEAEEQGKTLAAHLQHLVAHGVLHLVGYDHEDEAEAEVMEDLERCILAGLGLPDPYDERQGS